MHKKLDPLSFSSIGVSKLACYPCWQFLKGILFKGYMICILADGRYITLMQYRTFTVPTHVEKREYTSPPGSF